MDQEKMVKDMLSPEMIAAGAELTRLLDQSQLTVSASLWFYSPESNSWSLIIASPDVQIHGPKNVYGRVQTTLQQLSPQYAVISLADISVVDNNNYIIKLLRMTIHTSAGISGIRFSRNTINGHYIEDAYIYRMT